MILDRILNELQSNNIVTRKKAVVYINKGSRGNWTAANKDWLTDTRTISIIIDAIEQETDEKILLELVNTIGNISQRYEYYDPRTWNAICNIFEKKQRKIQTCHLGFNS